MCYLHMYIVSITTICCLISDFQLQLCNAFFVLNEVQLLGGQQLLDLFGVIKSIGLILIEMRA